MANLGVTQYLVFIRPKNSRGRIIYGGEVGATTDDFGNIVKGETLLINNGGTISDAEVEAKIAAGLMPNGTPIPVGTDVKDIPYRSNTNIPDSAWEPIIGQPFILHSITFGVEEALSKAAPLVIAYGKDNVKICKLLNHDVEVHMA